LDSEYPLPPPTDSRVYISHCHDERNPGKEIEGGWSERRFAAASNEALCLILREEGFPCWPIYRGTLANRIATLKSLSVAPVIELHFDWLPQRPEVGGYFAIVSDTNRAAQELGNSILDAIASAFPTRRSMGLCRASEDRRWVGTSKVYDGTRLGLIHDLPQHPVVIIEGCFLSNPTEAAWIKKIESRLTLGVAIGRGVAEFLRRTKKKPS
jgi:N-acetylmuramoyl-L-alanine amidase